MFGLLIPGVQGAQDDAYRRVCGEPAMSPHRLFRISMVRTVPLRSSRPLLHHRRHRCGLGVARLEDRTLLSGPSGDVLAAVAPKIALGTPKAGTLAPGEVAFFQINPNTDGRLVAQVHAAGATTRLSLWDAQGQVLMQSDGQSPGNPDDQIDLHVPAGTDYLEVEDLGGAGAYTLTTSLTPATTSPFQPILIPGDRAYRPRGGGLHRRRPHRPGRRQLRLQRRVGVAGQRRRHLPGPGDVSGGERARCPRGGGLHRRRPHRPGRRQLRLQRRVGVAGQRRRHLPEPGDVRGGERARRPRGGGLHRRRPHRPGRRQPRLQRRVGVAGQRRRHLPAPGAIRGGARARRPRGGGLHRRRPHRPGRRQLRRQRRVCAAGQRRRHLSRTE